VNWIITEDFVACFRALPDEIRERARKAYRLWKTNPAHPNLRFKQIQGHDKLYSVRVSRGWRALGLLDEGTMTWFWIGSHADYDQLLG
jgi:hypothetical protein